MGAMSDEEASDATLLGRYAAGEVGAFERLYRRHERRIWRYLERHLGERALAEELMQEVWFTVAREAPRWRPTAKFTTWLFTLAHHRLIDTVRARRRHVSLDAVVGGSGGGYGGSGGSGGDSGGSAGGSARGGGEMLAALATEAHTGPLAGAVAHQEARALRRALGELPLEQRDAFLLHVEAELAVEEVAAITGCPAETTKSRLRYARGKLRELLKEYA